MSEGGWSGARRLRLFLPRPLFCVLPCESSLCTLSGRTNEISTTARKGRGVCREFRQEKNIGGVAWLAMGGSVRSERHVRMIQGLNSAVPSYIECRQCATHDDESAINAW